MKTIYKPKGKAREYCHWACNLYNGCSNKCDYCYNRHSQAKNLLGKDEPTLKAGLANIDKAFHVFVKEFDRYKDKIMEDGGEIFFNFVSDPFLEETWELNIKCILHVLNTSDVVVRTLTKCPARLLNTIAIMEIKATKQWKIGFTITGFDELEKEADSNEKRIDAIKVLEESGYHTWASIEPIIRPYRSLCIMSDAYNAGCREFRIGILTGYGHLQYDKYSISKMKSFIDNQYNDCKILWKNSVIEFLKDK